MAFSKLREQGSPASAGFAVVGVSVLLTEVFQFLHRAFTLLTLGRSMNVMNIVNVMNMWKSATFTP